MKRLVIGTLASLLALGSLVPAAHAGPKKGKKAAAVEPKEAPQSEEIGKAMGDLKWGTSRDELLQTAMNAVKEKYKPLIAKSTGAIEEDKLRAKQRDELARIRSSLVEFNGTKTGWDVSFLKGEFTHGNQESMFVVNDDTSQNYYFFIQGKLWKWYKAFNTAVFQGKNFDQFADAIQGRYGKAQQREGELVPGQGKQRWLEWQDEKTRARAIDNGQFYGFYCLVFDDESTLARLDELRPNKGANKANTNAMVEAVTSGDDEGDSNKDVVDRITGNMRVRQQAPEPDKNEKKKGQASNKPAPSEPSVDKENDPLGGL
jgi:hypothetical protein